MRIAALTFLLLTAITPPVCAQSATPSALPASNSEQLDAMLILATEHLLANRRADATSLFRTALTIGGPPTDVPQIDGDQRFEVYKRWLDARSAAIKARDWPLFARWARLTAAYRLWGIAQDQRADADPIDGATFDDIYFLTYGLAMAGERERVSAFVQPFIDATNPAFEIAFAEDIFSRVQSVDLWGGEDKPKASALVLQALSLFDRSNPRAPEQVRKLYGRLGAIRKTAGDITGARAAYAKARAPGAPPVEAEIALMFDAGEIDAGIRAIQASLGQPAAPDLTLAATDKLVEIGGQTSSGNAGTLAIHRIALQNYRRLIKPDDRRFQNAASALAQALLESGDPAAAELLLTELTTAAERRWGAESNGAIGYAMRLAQAVEAQARLGEAELVYRRVWGLSVKHDSYDFEDSQDAFAGITRILLARGNGAEALTFTADGLRRIRAASDINAGRRMLFLLTRATVLQASGALGDAETIVREAIALGDPDDKFTIAAAFDTPDAIARARLATLLETQNKAADAEPIRRLLLKKIEQNDMIPWEGELRREALLALAANLTLQGKPEGSKLFGDRLAANGRIFGSDSPQSLEVAEPFARALLRSGRPAQALAPARIALAARTSARNLGDAAGVTQTDIARAHQRREAARLVVQAAWRTARPAG